MKKSILGAIALFTMLLILGPIHTQAQLKSKAMAHAVSNSFSGYFAPVNVGNLQPQSLAQFNQWLNEAAISPKTKQQIRSFLRPVKGKPGMVKVLKVSNVTYSATKKKGDAFLIFFHEDVQAQLNVSTAVLKVIETRKANADEEEDDDDCRFKQSDDCFCANSDNCDCVSCTGCGCGGCSGCGSSGGDDEKEVLSALVW